MDQGKDDLDALTINSAAVSTPGETIALDFFPTEDGYLYVYVVNESQKDVFFDDLTFSNEGTRVVRRTDYYPLRCRRQGMGQPRADPAGSLPLRLPGRLLREGRRDRMEPL